MSKLCTGMIIFEYRRSDRDEDGEGDFENYGG